MVSRLTITPVRAFTTPRARPRLQTHKWERDRQFNGSLGSSRTNKFHVRVRRSQPVSRTNSFGSVIKDEKVYLILNDFPDFFSFFKFLLFLIRHISQNRCKRYYKLIHAVQCLMQNIRKMAIHHRKNKMLSLWVSNFMLSLKMQFGQFYTGKPRLSGRA